MSLKARVAAFLRSDVLWVVFWSAPLWAAVFGVARKHHAPWFVDYNSMVCGAERSAAGQPLYTAAPCPGLSMSAYVYPPWVAQALGLPLRLLGERGLSVAYVALFVAALVFLFWLAFWRRQEGASRRERTPFLAFTAGNLVVVANVAVIAQAAMLAAAVFVGADSLACLAAVILASLIKPIYLTYLALPAFAPSGIVRRGALVIAGALLVTTLAASSLPHMAEWRAFLVQVAVDPDPGGGFMRWLGDFGVHDHIALVGCYVVYAGLLFCAGLAVAELARLSRADRLWLAATLAVLLLPRMMAYDIAVLGPGTVVAVRAATLLGERSSRRLSWVFRAACLIYLASSLLGGKAQIGHSLALMLLVGGLVWLGGALAIRRARLGPDAESFSDKAFASGR